MRHRRDLAYSLSAFFVAAGIWGLIGGWLFGLPIGGEMRENPYQHQWGISDLFTTIPDPALSAVPLIPKRDGRDYDDLQPQPQFAETVRWTEAELPPLANLQPPDKAAEQRQQQQQLSQPQQSASPPQQQLPQQQAIQPTGPSGQVRPLWRLYRTGLASSYRVITFRPAGFQDRQCLQVETPPTGNPACLIFAFDLPSGRARELATVPVTPETRLARLHLDRLGNPFLPPSGGTAPIPDFVLTLADVTAQLSGSESIFGVTIVLNPATPTALPTVWVGGFRKVFKLGLTADGKVTATTYALPIESPGPADLILFASATRGWVYSSQSAGRLAERWAPTILETADGGVSWRQLSYRWLPAPWVLIAFVFGFFAFERGTRYQAQLRPVAPQDHVTDHGVSDNPIGLGDGDALGLLPIAMSLSRFLRNVETKPTVAFAVTGPWGSGKSSLMNLVREDLEDRGVATVWFNAWHYQKEDNLLAALLTTIRTQAIPPIWNPAGINYRIRVAFRRVLEDPARTLVTIVLALFAAIILIRYGGSLFDIAERYAASIKSGEGAKTTQDSVTTILTAIGLSGTGLGALLITAKRLFDLFRPLKSLPGDLLASLSNTSSAGALDQQLSFRQRFAKEFAKFCEALRWPPRPGLVLFVDDLDRCDPKQTVDVLEAINFVTNAGKCFVVMGFDEAKVKAAVADRYKDVILRVDDVSKGKPSPEEVIAFASHYLEKLVHLVIAVPKSGRYTVERLLGLKPMDMPDQRERRLSRLRRVVVESVAAVILSTAVLSGLWLSLDILVHSASPPPAEKSEQARALAANAPPAGAPAAARSFAPSAPPDTDFAAPEQIRDAGLLESSGLANIPASVPVTAFLLVLGLLASQFIPRLFLIEPAVNDSPAFKTALGIWVEAIAKRRETPRDVKRFVNRIRFLAMRQRILEEEAEKSGRSVPLDEASLVSFAAIEDLDERALGRDLSGIESVDERYRSVVAAGLKEFQNRFSRGLYASADAVAYFKTLGGIVEERSGGGAQGDGSPQQAEHAAPSLRPA